MSNIPNHYRPPRNTLITTALQPVQWFQRTSLSCIMLAVACCSTVSEQEKLETGRNEQAKWLSCRHNRGILGKQCLTSQTITGLQETHWLQQLCNLFNDSKEHPFLASCSLLLAVVPFQSKKSLKRVARNKQSGCLGGITMGSWANSV